MLFALEQGMGQHRKSLQCDGHSMEVARDSEAFLVAYSSDIGKGGLCGALFQLLGKTCHFAGFLECLGASVAYQEWLATRGEILNPRPRKHKTR
jgi:hypothetical protein